MCSSHAVKYQYAVDVLDVDYASSHLGADLQMVLALTEREGVPFACRSSAISIPSAASGEA